MSERHQPDASSSSTEIDHPHEEKRLDAPNQEPEAEQPHDAENATEKSTEGAPLDHAPSQAAKMGKNKIIVVMTALCVRNLRRAGKAFGEYRKANSHIPAGSILGGFGYGTCSFIHPCFDFFLTLISCRRLFPPPSLLSPRSLVPPRAVSHGSRRHICWRMPPVFPCGARSVISGEESLSLSWQMLSSWLAV